MYRVLLLFLPFVFVTCTSDGPSTAPGESFSLAGFETTEIPGTNSVWAVRKDNNGLPLEEGTLTNGKRDGYWVVYHDDGKQIPKSIAVFVDGKLNGAQTEYNTRGGITALRHYLNDVLHGTSIDYKNGRLVKVENYQMGQLHGPQLSYYERSDQVQTEANFQDGLQHGLYRYFNEEGAVVLEYEYEMGEKVGGGPVEQE